MENDNYWDSLVGKTIQYKRDGKISQGKVVSVFREARYGVVYLRVSVL